MPLKKSKDAIGAWFGEEMLIEGGAMRFDGGLRVDGTIRDGHICGENLIIGDNAVVDGRITVDSVSVYGRLEGRAEVSTQVRVEPGGSFRGEMVLDSPSLVIEEGASFHGRVRSAKKAAKKKV